MVTTHQKARIHTQNIKRNTNPIVKVVIKSQENIKGKKKKSYKNKSPILNKVAIKKYISIILLSVNVLNAPTNETDWLNEYKNKPIYILSARSRDTDGLKVSRWKRYSLQMEIKRKLE